MKFAADRHIPAVHATWLDDSLSRGELLPYDAYMLNKPAQPLAHPQKPRQNANPQIVPSEKPIGPSRREANLQLHQNKAQEPKMITKPQGPPQPRALDMVLSDVTSASVDAFAHPNDSAVFSDAGQEDHSLGAFDGNFSLPLQERVPSDRNAKADARQRSSSAESLIRAAPAAHKPRSISETTSYTMPQQPPEEEEGEKDYSDILAKLRANRKAAPTPTDQADEKRRKRRLLGRATSTRSNQSVAEGSGHFDLNDVEDENSVLIPEYQPSQELGWDSPGAAKAREQMIKKLGGTVKERSVPAEGIGVVKDAVNESGLGRASRRRG
jgi:DNA replication regulator DPB11